MKLNQSQIIPIPIQPFSGLKNAISPPAALIKRISLLFHLNKKEMR